MKNIIFKEFKFLRMLGIDICTQPLLILILILFVPWTKDINEIYTYLIAVVCLIESVIIHELGHHIASISHGIKGDKIIINMFSGTYIFKSNTKYNLLTPLRRMKIAFFGPLMNLIVSIISVICIWIFFPEDSPFKEDGSFNIIQIYLVLMAGINMILFILNLLPIYPLDGGKIVDNILEHYEVENYFKYTTVISIITCIIFLPILIIYSLYIVLIIDIIIIISLIVNYRKSLNI